MKIHLHILAIYLFFIVLPNMAHAQDDDQYNNAFRGATWSKCDDIYKNLMNNDPYHNVPNKCEDMLCNDQLTALLAECWKKTMTDAVNTRLQKLKQSNPKAFKDEVLMQKNFIDVTEKICGRDCESGGTMHAIPYNRCRIDAYKYRSLQAFLINKNQLTVPLQDKDLTLRTMWLSNGEKTKYTDYYQPFAIKLCQMPNNIWEKPEPFQHCVKDVLNELNGFGFTDDVCDLS
jgi:hypothetical protein